MSIWRGGGDTAETLYSIRVVTSHSHSRLYSENVVGKPSHFSLSSVYPNTHDRVTLSDTWYYRIFVGD